MKEFVKEVVVYIEPISKFMLAGMILLGVFVITRLLSTTALNLPFFNKSSRKAYIRPVIWLLWLLGLMLALQQIGVQLDLVNSLILILAFVTFATLGVSFCLSTYHFFRNIVTIHFIKGEVQTGAHIGVDGKQGRVIELNPMYLILETEEGKFCLPISTLREKPVTINKDPDGIG